MKFNVIAKKVAAFVGAAALSFSLVACGGGSNNGGGDDAATETTTSDSGSAAATEGSSGGGKYKIGLSLPDRDQFLASLEKAVVESCEANGLDYEINVAKEDISTQLAQVEAFATNGCDALIISLTDNTAWQEVLNAAGDMKVVFFNRKPSDDAALDGERSVFVGMSEYDAGCTQGNWLVNYFKENNKPEEVNVVLFRGILGHPAVVGRTDGCIDTIEAAGYKVNFIADDTANFDKVEAMNKFTALLGKGDSIDAVICNNDEMALGCIEACNAGGLTIDFPIVGVDGTETGCKAILDGTEAMTVDQDPIVQGSVSVDCAIGLLEGSLPAEIDENNVYGIIPDAVEKELAQKILDERYSN